jgi:hypothetical protein
MTLINEILMFVGFDAAVTIATLVACGVVGYAVVESVLTEALDER